MELFLLLPAYHHKTSFTIGLSYVSGGSKIIFKTGNGIIQTGNRIISPTSTPLIKQLLLQNIYHFFQGFQYRFSKQELESSKQEMELFLWLPGL